MVLEEAGTRKVIFSSFDPDCATLLSLKQPRFPGWSNFTDESLCANPLLGADKEVLSILCCVRCVSQQTLLCVL